MSRPSPPAGPYLVVGLGRAGAAAATALAQVVGPGEVFAWDSAATGRTRAVAASLRELGVEVTLGGDGASALDRRPGALVKSPGIAARSMPIAAASAAGVPVIDELDLGFRLGCSRLVGVTGTNGKGTVTQLVTHALRAGGLRAEPAGNWEFGGPLSAVRPPEDAWVVCEVSSFQLEHAPAFRPDIGVFTNLAHDHLDRHGSMAVYAEVKASMFVRGDWAVPTAVIGLDDPVGRSLASRARARGSRVLGFGFGEGADYRIAACRWDAREAALRLGTPVGPVTIEHRLPGRHNALNLAAALAAADAAGVERSRSLEALASAPGVPARFQLVDAGQPFDVVRDYAHNPGAYRAVLEASRHVVDARGGRLSVQISSNAGYDSSKRPEMGRIARRLSDRLLITRGVGGGGEDPARPVAQLLAGARESTGATVEVVDDRGEAIRSLVRGARPADLVMVLGRGDRPQPLGGRDADGDAFDDGEALRAAIGEVA